MPKKTQKKSRLRSRGNYYKHFVVALIIFVIAWFATSPQSLGLFRVPWYEPPRFESENGKLSRTFTAAKTKAMVGASEKETNIYNGNYPGETLVVRGGDTIKINIENKIHEDTNLHFHGSHVSPKDNSDNVFVQIKPGENFEYEYRLPGDHPPGLYWYHPHWHGYTEDQVGDGMAGAIIIKGDIDELAGIKGLPERLLVLTTQSNPNNDGNDPIRLVNGKLNPTIDIRPGEIQRWRILNAAADDFFNFSIPGLKFYIISHDGNTTSKPLEQESELMAPGDRIEILVRGPSWGEYAVSSIPFDQGFAKYIDRKFLTLKSFGLPVFGMEMPKSLIPFEDFRYAEIDNTRKLVFSIDDADPSVSPQYLLDGKIFDPNRIDQEIILGTTEEWELINNSDEWHPFHIHINPFQVIEINGESVDRYGYDDTFGIPANGSVKIRTTYRDFDGKFVLHCHILFHEDHGMMQVVRIIDPENPEASLVNSEFDQEHDHQGGKLNSQRGRRVDVESANHATH